MMHPTEATATASAPDCTIRLLLVDDDAKYGAYLRTLLASVQAGIQVDCVTSIAAGLRELARGRQDVCLLDYRLGSENGLDLLRSAQSIEPKMPVVLLTGDGDPTLELAALEIGAADYLDKSEVDAARLLRCIQRAIARHRADTSLRKRERALAASEREYRTMVRNAVHGIFKATTDGRFLAINPALASMLGYASEEDVLSLGHDEVYQSAGERDHVLRQLTSPGGRNRVETSWKRRDGSTILVSISGHAAAADDQRVIVGIAEDITEHRRLEEQLRQSQKMEAIGQLAGGVAHDFNNLLTVILGYTALLRDENLGPDLQADLEQIERAGRSAAALTGQLLAFSRKQMLNPQVVSVNAVISEADRLLSRLLGEDIQVLTNLRPDISDVEADPIQLQQVILNLAINARDAMPLGGRLRIQTAEIHLRTDDGPTAAKRLAPGRYVAITVRDEGCGMDAATRSRIFEPFFSTKEQGRGTGLGLATVFGIVKQTGGEIICESAPGCGTTFRVLLPATTRRRAREAAVDTASVPVCSGTVLLVEDDAPLRRLARRVLESSGFQVLEAQDAGTALRIAATSEFDLMLIDIVLPDMSGHDLAESIARRAPRAKVLLMSGFSGHPALRGSSSFGDAPMLEKPFTPAALVIAVAEAIEWRGQPRRHAQDDAGCRRVALAG